MTAGRCFALLAAVALGGAALGGGACWALGLALPEAGAWLCLGAGAVLAAAAGTPVLRRWMQAMAQGAEAASAAEAAQSAAASAAQSAAQASASAAQAAAYAEAQRRLRHDVRGALSPALLTADRLLTNADPAVKRAGDIMVQAVEKAAELLADAAKPDGK